MSIAASLFGRPLPGSTIAFLVMSEVLSLLAQILLKTNHASIFSSSSYEDCPTPGSERTAFGQTLLKVQLRLMGCCSVVRLNVIQKFQCCVPYAIFSCSYVSVCQKCHSQFPVDAISQTFLITVVNVKRYKQYYTTSSQSRYFSKLDVSSCSGKVAALHESVVVSSNFSF